jgi:hypothetical protein
VFSLTPRRKPAKAREVWLHHKNLRGGDVWQDGWSVCYHGYVTCDEEPILFREVLRRKKK